MTNEPFLPEMPARLQNMVPPRNEWTPVDHALFTRKSFFDDYDAAQDACFEAVKHSFEHHFTNNRLYHRLCLVEDVSPESIVSQNDYLRNTVACRIRSSRITRMGKGSCRGWR